MISLCDKIVVIYQYQAKSGLPSGNDVWIFNVDGEFWHKIGFSQQSHLPTARRGHSAVVVSNPTSRCQCKESMLMYGGNYISSTKTVTLPMMKGLLEIFGSYNVRRTQFLIVGEGELRTIQAELKVGQHQDMVTLQYLPSKAP